MSPSKIIKVCSRGYKTLFMLNSTEHEMSTAHKTKIPTEKRILALSFPDFVFIMLINVKMSTLVDILIYYEQDNFSAQLS